METLISKPKSINNKTQTGGDHSINIQADAFTINIEHNASTNQQAIPKQISSIIYRISTDDIIGRDKELNELHSQLFGLKSPILIKGMGGLGKTSLARLYVSSYLDNYHHIIWVSQFTESFQNDLIATPGILGRLAINTEGSQQELFERIMHKLSLVPSPCLLIIDNAEQSLEGYVNYFPKQWHILATSRESISNFNLLDLDVLSEDACISLFKKYYERTDLPETEIKFIVEMVEYHTLVIEILAKAASRQYLEIDSLKKAIQNDVKVNVKVNHSSEKIERIRSYLSSVFKFSNLTVNERWMLAQFSCLPSKYIDYNSIKNIINPNSSGREDVFAEILADLVDKSWLFKSEDGYKVHRIITDIFVAGGNIHFNDLKPLLNSIRQQINVNNPAKSFFVIPFAISFLNIFDLHDEDLIDDLQNSLANLLGAFGLDSDALKYAEKSIRFSEKKYGVLSEETGVRYSNVGCILNGLRRFQEAEIFFKKSIISFEFCFGADSVHKRIATSYCNLATSQGEQNNNAKAKTSLLKAIKMESKIYGENSLAVAETKINLATCYAKNDEFVEAINLIKNVINFYELLPDKNYLRIAGAYRNYSEFLIKVNDRDGAIEKITESLRIFRKIFPDNHPQILHTVKRLNDFNLRS